MKNKFYYDIIKGETDEDKNKRKTHLVLQEKQDGPDHSVLLIHSCRRRPLHTFDQKWTDGRRNGIRLLGRPVLLMRDNLYSKTRVLRFSRKEERAFLSQLQSEYPARIS